MKKRKIGLLNLQYVDNYGANLISFAMEQTVKELSDSSDITTINYCPNDDIVYRESIDFKNYCLQFGFKNALVFHTRRLYKSVINTFRKSKLFYILKKILKRNVNTVFNSSTDNNMDLRLMNFEIFREKSLNLSVPCEKEQIFQQGYDTIIVGSDVVWKPQRLLSQYVNGAFFLDSELSFNRVAYAASLGISDKKQMKRLAKYYKKSILKFNWISIRETSGTEYIQKIVPNKKIYNCIDPVFLRPATEYEALITRNAKTKPYIYAYILGKNPDAIRYVNKLAEKKGLDVLYHSNSKPEIGINTETDGPYEFLERIKNAEYIITDSFHGTAFSIIFRKQFLTFTRGVLSIRLEDFLTHIGLKSRLIASIDENTNIDAAIAYDEVWSYLDNWISKSKEFLKNALNNEESK